MADHSFTGSLYVEGNVGIGTEPLSNAQLYTRSSNSLAQVLVENSDGALLKLAVDTSGVTIGTDTGITQPLTLHTNGQPRLSIASGGAIEILEALSVQKTLSVTGNVAIGTATTPATLNVQGTLEARGATFNGSLTVQDTVTITGNVAIAGDLAINSGSFQVSSGAITPAVGNAENAGIRFPRNLAGGSGDAAWVRYYPRTGEACTLEIGIANDANDHLSLIASGGVGIGNGTPDRALTIQGSGNTYMNVKANNGTQEILLGADTGGGILSTMTNHDLQLRAGNNTTRLIVKANGRIGIGTNDPQAQLDVSGSIKGNGALAGIWAAQPLSAASIAAVNTWQNVVDTSVSFKLDRDAAVFFTYSININPDGNPANNYLATRLLIDNSPYRSSASHYQPYSTADSNVNLNGNLVLFLAAGDHTATLQWYKTGTAPTWSSNPGWGDGYVGGRTLIVTAFYWPRPFTWVRPITTIPIGIISRIDSSQLR